MIELSKPNKRLRSLNLRWRPSKFEEVVGQGSTIRILRHSVLRGETSHAYLFAGPRGTGKTSVARIMAKAINCEDPKDGEPCNECKNCKAIDRGTSLDIVEIDGASNRGIDKIRELREEVNYTPAELQYKVYIIDEVHMLTTQAFNALLKTLEEPPDRVTFIFATTEPEKIPTTIISRCQVFEFKEIPQTQIIERLQEVVHSEDISITDEALKLIAGRAKGSMRDGLVLLEQVLPYSSEEKIDRKSLVDLLGLASSSNVTSFISSLVEGRPKDILEEIDNLVSRGKDLEIFLEAVLEELRERIVEEPSPEKLRTSVGLSRGILDLLDDLRKSSNKRVTLEIGSLELVENCLDRTEEIPEEPHPVADNQQVDAPPIREENTEEVNGLKNTSEWQSLIKEIESDRISIAAFLGESDPVVRNRDLILEFTRDHAFHKESLEEDKNQNYLQEVVTKYFEDVDKVRIIYKEDAGGEEKEDDLLSKKADLVKRHFGGTIVERGRRRRDVNQE